MNKLTFLGAAGTVTGSKHLLQLGERRILVDCGLFQGMKDLRLLNWEPFPVSPASIDTVVLTHAHIDHTGYLPRLVADGFAGRILGTPATVDLASILLRDAGRLQEEEARYFNKKGASKHSPAKPLYTEEDGIRAAERIEGFGYHQRLDLGGGVHVTFRRAGHILGSATVTFEVDDGATGRRIVFSGDLGRDDSLLQLPPEPMGEADYVIMESTYGNRLHTTDEAVDAVDERPGVLVGPADRQLEEAVKRAVKRGGALIIPAFAVARTQTLLFLLNELETAGRIPELPIFLDSPMAIDATDLYRRHAYDLKPEIRHRLKSGDTPLRPKRLTITRSPQDSRAINDENGPMIILSASGMATGGRVVHHLLNRVGRPDTTVLLAGYQVPGTRGWRLQRGEKTLRLFGENVPVRAHIETLTGLSAHGDQKDLLDWLQTSRRPPEQTFLVHGDVPAFDALKAKIDDELGWPATIPARGQSFTLRS